MKLTIMNANNKLLKHIMGVGFVAALLLLFPLIGMQFSEEVMWTYTDFIFAGILLFGTGTAFVFALHKMQNSSLRLGAGIALVSTFLLVWVNLAVGIVGHEGESINMLYFTIPVIGVIGAFLSRFRSQGMSYTLLIMAIVPMIIAVIALMGYLQEPPHNSVSQILGVNAFFTVLFSLSAISFRNASHDVQEFEADI